MHAVQQLYQYRKSLSTKPFNARGKGVNRCQLCQCAMEYCICHLRPKTQSQVGFVLLMHDIEVLKPSNTGRLIADIITDTFAFLWQRTNVEKKLIELLSDKKWQPIVIFPEHYVDDDTEVFVDNLPSNYLSQNVKRPLFILLDGSWREAKKMFRKSPYLKGLPVLSISINRMKNVSDSYIRQASEKHQFATAQVAAQALQLAGEEYNGKLLNHWFDVFNFQYQRSVCQPNAGDEFAVQRLETLVNSQ